MDIKFESGVKEYNLGGKVTVEFNPTDVGFANKMFDAFSALDAKTEEYQKRINENKADVFAISRDMDAEMRDIINGLFGKDVCTPLIGDINIYARADGLPLWANLILAVMDVMEVTAQAEDKAAQKRIDKYTKKYHL